MTLRTNDRIDLIRLFLRVAEAGQISGAAEALGLPQPTASRSLKRLEALLGTRLADRSATGLSLTQAGRDFIAPAQRMLDAWHEAVDAAQADTTAMSGPIRVAAPIAIGQSLLAVIAARFLRAHPDITIEWHLCDDQLDPLSTGYDLWIRAGEIDRDDLVVRHIYRVKRALVTAPGGPRVEHPRDLVSKAAARLATFVPPVVRLRRDSGEVFLLRQRATFVTNNLYAARAAVLEGVGYAVLPLWCVQADLATGQLVTVCEDWRPPEVDLSLAYAPSRVRSSRVAALVAYLQTDLHDDHGPVISFLRATGAMESVTQMRPSAGRGARPDEPRADGGDDDR